MNKNHIIIEYMEYITLWEQRAYYCNIIWFPMRYTRYILYNGSLFCMQCKSWFTRFNQKQQWLRGSDEVICVACIRIMTIRCFIHIGSSESQVTIKGHGKSWICQIYQDHISAEWTISIVTGELNNLQNTRKYICKSYISIMYYIATRHVTVIPSQIIHWPVIYQYNVLPSYSTCDSDPVSDNTLASHISV